MKGRFVLALALLLYGGAQAGAEVVDISYPIEARGAVRLDISYGTVRIVGARPGRVRVTGESDDRLRGISVRDEAGAVEIRERWSWLDRLRALGGVGTTYGLRITVELPRDTRLFVVSRDADISVEGVEGPIGVGVVSSDVVIRGEPSRVDFEAVSGGLDFAGRSSWLQATTLSGDLRAAGVDGRLRLEAATGSLEVEDSRLEEADLTTVSGAITVRGSSAGSGLLELRSESGDVVVECCGVGGATLDLVTRDGEVLNEIGGAEPLRDARGRRVLQFVVDAGATTIRVRTRSGLIRLRPPGASD